MIGKELPIPAFFDPEKVGAYWKVSYEERARQAREWAREHHIRPAAADEFRVCLLAIDVQNTFCLPDFELFVAGRSGTGAVDDNRRLCEFIYRNLGLLTEIIMTMDTHQPLQIFHSIFLVDENGQHPEPYTLISAQEVSQGKWQVNPEVCKVLGMEPDYARKYLLHYTRQLEQTGKYQLTIWPYHAMLGGIGHAIVSAVEEAVFFHSVARHTQPHFEIKGNNPLTEHYSVFGPEVKTGPAGEVIGTKNEALIRKLTAFDAIVVAGEAKSHCVAWSVEDLLQEFRKIDPSLPGRVYLLEDCTSPVVVPGAIDYTKEADEAYQRFAEAGMHIVRSTQPVSSWPGIGK